MRSRRSVLAAGAAMATAGIAGCTGTGSEETANGPATEQDADGDAGGGEGSESAPDGDGEGAQLPGAEAWYGVAAAWTGYRARVADAHALGTAGEYDAGAGLTGDVFAEFEGATGEWGAHERLEDTDHEHYEGFEGALEEMRDQGFEARDLERARETAAAADGHLADATGVVLSHRDALAFDLAALAARLADVETLATAGAFDAADTLARGVDRRWESSLLHDEVSAADSDLYTAFESPLRGVRDPVEAEDPEGVRSSVADALDAAFDLLYALSEADEAAHAAALALLQARCRDAGVLADLEEVDGEAAVAVVQDVLARFEAARAHEAVEHADEAAYESYEGSIEAYAEALSSDEGVDESASTVADATLRAQFAVAGAVEDAPVGEAEHGGSGDHDHHDDLAGGPNVVADVHADADHVVEIRAASFEPARLTVSAGDTVAFEHVEGEPHTVTAYADGLPADADYWASGDFEDEAAARDGWADGRGAVAPDRVYVRTFETPGTHEYFCVPHEAAGHTGEIVVE